MDILILAAATWRISNLLAYEAGPFDIIQRLRNFAGVEIQPTEYNNIMEEVGTNVLSRMLICVYCSSMWIGLLWTILYLILPEKSIYLALPLALSAVAVILDNIERGE